MVLLICKMAVVAPHSWGCGAEVSTAEAPGASGQPAAVVPHPPFPLQIPLVVTRAGEPPAGA